MKRMILAVVVVVALGRVAFADPILKISDGSVLNTFTVSDQGVGDLDPTPGSVVFIGAVGVWSVNVATGWGSAINGPSSLDLNSIDTKGTLSAASTLNIWLTETGFTNTLAGWAWLMSYGGVLTAPVGSTASYDAFYDNANGAFVTTSLIGTLGPFGPGAFSGSILPPVAASLTAPYSLTQQITISAASGLTTYSGNATLAPVPEPASLLLLGTGLLGLAGIRRRNRKSKAS